MADPATYRPAPGSVPDAPGVYRFSDSRGRVVYVGKAKSLRSRLGSYFQDLAALHSRTQAMVQHAARVEWTVVNNEVEALQLEYAWIKEYDPRFNVKYRDDKSYPWLAVTLDEEFPRLQVMRGAKRKGVRYFGPYAHAWAIRETLDLLLRVFPARTCSKGVFKRAIPDRASVPAGLHRQVLGTVCGRSVTPEEHRAIVDDFCDFMAGHYVPYVKRVEREMKAASAELEFERAARLRDDLKALERALEKNAVVLPDGTDADVVALAEDQLEVAVQVFHVRGGRIRGQRGWVADKTDDADTGELVERLLIQLYGAESADGGAPRGTRAGRSRRCRRARRLARGSPSGPGRPAGAPARRQAVPDGDGRPQREAVPHAAQDEAGQRPHHSQHRAPGDPGRPRARGRAPAYRVLRRLQPAGIRRGGIDGGLRGRVCLARATTGASSSRAGDAARAPTTWRPSTR